MNGDWGVKSIIKAIPDCKISYEGDGILSGGADAGLAWFICTDPKTTVEEKEKQKKLLLEYCSKDTFALYYLIKYFFEQNYNNKAQEEAVISVLILLSISDNELHNKERQFIENLISEKNFAIDIDKELDQIHSKFRDDFDTAGSILH